MGNPELWTEEKFQDPQIYSLLVKYNNGYRSWTVKLLYFITQVILQSTVRMLKGNCSFLLVISIGNSRNLHSKFNETVIYKLY
jgi:hypothetical protein